MEEKTEGIILRSIPYLGSQKILKVFTPEAGLISLMAKKLSFAPFTSPFLVAEWVYKKGKEEIHLLKDASLLNPLSELRNDYATLSAAGEIAQDLLRSQLPAKKGGALYSLVLSYFGKLPLFARPETLAASFRLKLLLHEGLLAIQPECALCGAPAQSLSSGESFCPCHAGHAGHADYKGHAGHGGIEPISFTRDEWALLLLLANARRFAILQPLQLSPTLQKKIGLVFEEGMRR